MIAQKRLYDSLQLKILILIYSFSLLMITNGWCSEASHSAQHSGSEHLENKWEYSVLPQMTNQERYRLALEARRNSAKYFSEARNRIEGFSEELEEYIRDWIKGKATARFPTGLLPEFIDNEKTHAWKLVRPDEIDPQEQWYAMPAYDPSEELHQFSPDPHATYLKLIFIAPLGAKLLIEGDFPHARFMDYQILGPIDPEHPGTGQMGICEVPIVDVDIEPDPGHVNPFRRGADRNSKKRRYHLVFKLGAGNAVDLNPEVMKAPEYRGSGNTRMGGSFAFTGPWGNNVLVPSVLWLRYYAPDFDSGALGGVPLPKATLQVESGEKFWITCDKSISVKLQTTPVPRLDPTPAIEPYPFLGPDLGWFKMYGILHLHAEARAYYKSEPWGRLDPLQERKKIRQLFSIIFNRGANAKPPGNYETAATVCNYISYLTRPMNLGKNKVIVITGKLPAFPSTRNAEKTMSSGDVRYFSITHQVGTNAKYNKGYHGTPYGSLMDDEVILNDNNDYIIVYSRKHERPSNAKKKNGVTWQAWGTPSSQTFIVRWLSVMPEWYLPTYSPHENNIPWERGAWSGAHYDRSIVGENRPGIMGNYHPIVHYMTKQEFESFGNNLIALGDTPKWTIASSETAHAREHDMEQKVKNLFKAIDDLQKARMGRDREAIRTSAKTAKRIWTSLSDEIQRAIESKHPGIQEEIESIP